QELAAGVLGMDFRGDRFRASLDFGYQKERVNSPLRPTFVNSGIGVPLAPGGRDNWFQPWTYVNTEDVFGVVKAEYDVTPDWTIFAGASGRSNRFESLSGFANVTNANGNLIDTPAVFPTASVAKSQEVGIRGRAETGPVKHALSLAGNH